MSASADVWLLAWVWTSSGRSGVALGMTVTQHSSCPPQRTEKSVVLGRGADFAPPCHRRAVFRAVWYLYLNSSESWVVQQCEVEHEGVEQVELAEAFGTTPWTKGWTPKTQMSNRGI